MDTHFLPGISFRDFVQDQLLTSVQPDGAGGVYVLGQFKHRHDGDPWPFALNRLIATGLLDNTFDFGPQLHVTTASAVQSDGKILISGVVGGPLTMGNFAPNQILRVFPDGSPDPSFVSLPFSGGKVRMLTILPDGRILAGGLFTEVDGTPATGLVRLNSDGSLDESFHIPVLDEHPGTTFFPTGIWAPIVLDGSGKILIGGIFGAVDGFPREGFARLNEDGTLDTAYPADGFSIANGRPVQGIGIQSDGKLVIGGRLDTDDASQVLLVRLDLNGNRDPSFNLLDRFSPRPPLRRNCIQRAMPCKATGGFGSTATLLPSIMNRASGWFASVSTVRLIPPSISPRSCPICKPSRASA